MNASRRSAISRAYYGVLVTARNALDQRGLPSGRGSGRVHGTVPAQLKKYEDRQVYALGNTLEEMRRRRKEADYEDEIDAERVLREQLALAVKAEEALPLI